MESQSIDAQGQNQQNQSSEKDPIVKGLFLINEGIKTMNLNLWKTPPLDTFIEPNPLLEVVRYIAFILDAPDCIPIPQLQVELLMFDLLHIPNLPPSMLD